MSQWTGSRSQQAARSQQHPAHHFAQHPEHQQSRDGASRRAAREPAARTGYTIAHAGRQVRFGPVVFWIAVGTVVIMAGWAIAAGAYLAFRGDVLRTLIPPQAEQQFAYEDRIAELRAQIDRTTSRQLLDQEQVEQKLDDLMRRETTLESHATAMSGVGDPATTGAIKPPANGQPRSSGKQSNIKATLGRLEASLDHVEHRQSLMLTQMQDRYEGKARQLRGVLIQLGLKFNTAPSATGGPFVPVKLGSDNEGFQ